MEHPDPGPAAARSHFRPMRAIHRVMMRREPRACGVVRVVNAQTRDRRGRGAAGRHLPVRSAPGWLRIFEGGLIPSPQKRDDHMHAVRPAFRLSTSPDTEASSMDKETCAWHVAHWQAAPASIGVCTRPLLGWDPTQRLSHAQGMRCLIWHRVPAVTLPEQRLGWRDKQVGVALQQRRRRRGRADADNGAPAASHEHGIKRAALLQNRLDALELGQAACKRGGRRWCGGAVGVCVQQHAPAPKVGPGWVPGCSHRPCMQRSRRCEDGTLFPPFHKKSMAPTSQTSPPSSEHTVQRPGLGDRSRRRRRRPCPPAPVGRAGPAGRRRCSRPGAGA